MVPETQKDFFDEIAENEKKKKSFFRSQEFRKISFSSSFDALLLGFLILMMAIVIVYAIGVEVGNRERMRLTGQGSIKTAVTQTVLPRKEESLPPITKVMPSPQKKEPTGKYTIQIASYTQRNAAEQALEKAKRESGGAEVFLIGTKQFALCVGSYETREAANRALSEFQKRYKDSFVRNR